MSRNGSGVMTIPTPDFVAGTTISSDQVDANNNDIVNELTNSIAADGQTTPTANLKMGGYKHTGLGAGNAATDSLTLGQAQANAYTYQGTDSGAADAYVIALVPAITTQAAGLRVSFVAANASTGASTLNAGGGVDAIEYQGAALVGVEIAAGSTIVCEHDGTAWQMVSPSALLGNVVGPASATADSLAKFSGTTGKLLKNGAVIGADVQAFDADTTKNDEANIFTAIQDMSAAGAYFGGTAAANLLDNFKKDGIWTPVFSDASVGGNVAAGGTFSGEYHIIDGKVTIIGRGEDIDTTGMTAGNILFVQGIPIAPNAATALINVGNVRASQVTFSGHLTASIPDASTFITFHQTITANVGSQLTVAGLSSGIADTYFEVSYFI